MTTMSSGGADLQALMAIADRFARRLAMVPGTPVAALLLERAGALDIVMLDGEGRDVIPHVRLLLAQSGATSAALLLEVPAASMATIDAGFWIIGESIEGMVARRRYRVRPCGRRRRLTLSASDDNSEVEAVLRPLFPVHIKAEDTADVIAEVSSAGRDDG